MLSNAIKIIDTNDVIRKTNTIKTTIFNHVINTNSNNNNHKQQQQQQQQQQIQSKPAYLNCVCLSDSMIISVWSDEALGLRKSLA